MGVFLRQGVLGVALLAWLTATRLDEPARIIGALGPSAPILITILVLFAFTLALLKFALTDQIFVSLMVTAVFASYPLLGAVMTSWIAVITAIGTRGLGILQIGPVKIDVTDKHLEQARLFGMFGTYGIPAVFGTIVYEWLGGVVPLLKPSVTGALQIAAYAVVFTLANNVITGRVENAFGYSLRMSLKLGVIDSSIYMITLPFAMLTTFSYGAIGWGGTLAAAFTGVVTNVMARKLTAMRTDKELLARRLASLTNIGKTISLRHSTDDLLKMIYNECRKAIDVSIFGIALLDETKQELNSVLAVEQNKSLPPFRFPLGEGLTSWVIRNREPLLLASAAEERALGLTSIDDGLPTESWLGVPMIAREHILGVISVESYKKNAFSQDDVVLLTTIANQAAVAIDDANLFQDLEQINTVLEMRVEERTNELRETNLRLLAADRSKNQFLANMSHELRTPLNSIIGFSSVLLDATKETMQPRLYKFMQNIRTAGNHLLTLINDILDLSKIESGKLQINPHSFDLRDTIGTVERVMKGIAAETHVSIVTNIDPNVNSVFLDEGRVKQVLLNLLSNAVKFSHNGDFVYVTVKRIPERDSKLECDSVRIDVQDHGIGIPATELDKIFEEFYQVRAPGSLHRGGTGLGLPLTRSFVELHRGKVEVSSTIGDGSTFTIMLPMDYRVLSARSMREVKSTAS
jgi:signal transduction histidine kinase